MTSLIVVLKCFVNLILAPSSCLTKTGFENRFVFMRRYFDCLLMGVFDVLADGSV